MVMVRTRVVGYGYHYSIETNKMYSFMGRYRISSWGMNVSGATQKYGMVETVLRGIMWPFAYPVQYMDEKMRSKLRKMVFHLMKVFVLYRRDVKRNGA